MRNLLIQTTPDFQVENHDLDVGFHLILGCGLIYNVMLFMLYVYD